MIDAGTQASAGLARHRETTAVLGMTSFIASWVMLSAGGSAAAPRWGT